MTVKKPTASALAVAKEDDSAGGAEEPAFIPLTRDHDRRAHQLVQCDADRRPLDLVLHGHPVQNLEPGGDGWGEERASPGDDAAVYVIRRGAGGTTSEEDQAIVDAE